MPFPAKAGRLAARGRTVVWRPFVTLGGFSRRFPAALTVARRDPRWPAARGPANPPGGAAPETGAARTCGGAANPRARRLLTVRCGQLACRSSVARGLRRTGPAGDAPAPGAQVTGPPMTGLRGGRLHATGLSGDRSFQGTEAFRDRGLSADEAHGRG